MAIPNISQDVQRVIQQEEMQVPRGGDKMVRLIQEARAAKKEKNKELYDNKIKEFQLSVEAAQVAQKEKQFKETQRLQQQIKDISEKYAKSQSEVSSKAYTESIQKQAIDAWKNGQYKTAYFLLGTLESVDSSKYEQLGILFASQIAKDPEIQDFIIKSGMGNLTDEAQNWFLYNEIIKPDREKLNAPTITTDPESQLETPEELNLGIPDSQMMGEQALLNYTGDRIKSVQPDPNAMPMQAPMGQLQGQQGNSTNMQDFLNYLSLTGQDPTAMQQNIANMQQGYLTPEEMAQIARKQGGISDTNNNSILANLELIEKHKDNLTAEGYDQLRKDAAAGKEVDITKHVIEPEKIKEDDDIVQIVLDKYDEKPDESLSEDTPDTTTEQPKVRKVSPNRKMLGRMINLVPNTDREVYASTIDRIIQGRSFDELTDEEKNEVARININQIKNNTPGGDIAKRNIQAYNLLLAQLPSILDEAKVLAEQGKLGRLQQGKEGIARWFGGVDEPDVARLRVRINDVLNAFIALRSGAQVTEKERSMYQSIMANIGFGYEGNKAAIDGLLTNVIGSMANTYAEGMGIEWGEHAARYDLSKNKKSISDDVISDILKSHGIEDNSTIQFGKLISLKDFSKFYIDDMENYLEKSGQSVETYRETFKKDLQEYYNNTLSEDDISKVMEEFDKAAEKLSEKETKSETTISEDGILDYDGESYNMAAEIQKMQDVDEYDKKQILKQLKEWYPNLDEKILREQIDKFYKETEEEN